MVVNIEEAQTTKWTKIIFNEKSATMAKTCDQSQSITHLTPCFNLASKIDPRSSIINGSP